MALSDAPGELQVCIQEFWLPEEWENAAAISQLESNWNAFAIADTTDANHPCGSRLSTAPDGTVIVAERSIGYFQINTCNFPSWEWQRLYNAYQNCGTAHMLWDGAGQSWSPWYFSAKKLGLI